MPSNINEVDWLTEFEKFMEQDIPPLAGQPDMGAGGPPMFQPGAPEDPMGRGGMQTDPMAGLEGEIEDISGDPQYPDLPEEQPDDSFEVWKIKYFKESIKGDPNILVDMIMSIRDRELEPNERRFVEENLQINFLRQNANIFEASSEIRKLIKQDMDRTHPATSVVNHITEVLDKNPLLNEVYIKLSGLHGGKGAVHRQFLAALIGGVQVGSGGSEEDIIFEEKDYSIRISSRFNARWGDINVGRWQLKEDDPERFLKEPELKRLDGGSPEEKDVLRRRVIIESIAQLFLERAFIINVTDTDGTIHHLGWDIGNSLKTAFVDGKLVVRTKDSDLRDAFIDEEGATVSIPNMNIYYVKEAEVSVSGKAGIEEIEFMKHRDGTLYLTAQLPLVKEASVSLQGMVIKETPFAGNPSDLLRISRCTPSMPETILRQC